MCKSGWLSHGASEESFDGPREKEKKKCEQKQKEGPEGKIASSVIEESYSRFLPCGLRGQFVFAPSAEHAYVSRANWAESPLACQVPRKLSPFSRKAIAVTSRIHCWYQFRWHHA
jgi:hypothetical protein